MNLANQIVRDTQAHDCYINREDAEVVTIVWPVEQRRVPTVAKLAGLSGLDSELFASCRDAIVLVIPAAVA
jgi:hypothetical protein